jgi:hypothetical protein
VEPNGRPEQEAAVQAAKRTPTLAAAAVPRKDRTPANRPFFPIVDPQTLINDMLGLGGAGRMPDFLVGLEAMNMSGAHAWQPQINKRWSLYRSDLGSMHSDKAWAAAAAVGCAGGPVMYRPQVEDKPAVDSSTLPLLLYLPGACLGSTLLSLKVIRWSCSAPKLPRTTCSAGIDGTGLAAYRQFPHLVQRFDLRALYMPPSDRSSFEEIVAAAQVPDRCTRLACMPLESSAGID